MASFEIVTFPVGILQCNCSIVLHPSTKTAVVVDPGDDVEQILGIIKSHNIVVKALWHTHAHLDHIGATATLWNECKSINEKNGAAAPQIFLYKEDSWLYNNVPIQASLIGMNSFDVVQPTDLLTGKTKIVFDEMESFLSPGHTPGSACLKINSDCDFEAPQEFLIPRNLSGRKVLFTGDTLFRRSIGRTDLWGGSFPTIEKSIQNKIYTLDDDLLVIPGHGPFTTI